MKGNLISIRKAQSVSVLQMHHNMGLDFGSLCVG